jgi:RNA polymerase primary sigma factor
LEKIIDMLDSENKKGKPATGIKEPPDLFELEELEELVDAEPVQPIPLDPVIDDLVITETDNLGKYIKDIGNTPLLNREQEFWAGIDIYAKKHYQKLIFIQEMDESQVFHIIRDDFRQNWKNLKMRSLLANLPGYDWGGLISEILLQGIKSEYKHPDDFFFWVNEMISYGEAGKQTAGIAVDLYIDLISLPPGWFVRIPAGMAVGVDPFTEDDEFEPTLNFTDSMQGRFNQIQSRSSQARELLVVSNLRLVFSVAHKYMGRGLGLEDLIQFGNLGLMRALNKFDPCSGYRFSTYSYWWIMQAVTRAIADFSRMIRIPVHMHDRLHQIAGVRARLVQELQRAPTDEEVIEKCGNLSAKNVRLARTLNQEPMSLDEPRSDDENSVLGDLIPDGQDVDNEVISNMLHEELEIQLEQIPARERKVLNMRYGLNGEEPCTLEEVGRRMGVTRERVRQIEAQAMARLRIRKVTNKLKDYLD